jgi:hypothetical protein
MNHTRSDSRINNGDQTMENLAEQTTRTSSIRANSFCRFLILSQDIAAPLNESE